MKEIHISTMMPMLECNGTRLFRFYDEAGNEHLIRDKILELARFRFDGRYTHIEVDRNELRKYYPELDDKDTPKRYNLMVDDIPGDITSTFRCIIEFYNLEVKVKK